MMAQARKEQELATGIIMNETETSQDKADNVQEGGNSVYSKSSCILMASKLRLDHRLV